MRHSWAIVALGITACTFDLPPPAADTDAGSSGRGGSGAAGQGGNGASAAIAGASGIAGTSGSGASGGTGGSGCSCSGAGCSVPLAENLGEPKSLELWGDWVYFGDNSNERVYRVPKSCGPVEELATIVNPEFLALDASFVYVASYAYSIARIPNAGGTPFELYAPGNGDPWVFGFTTDSENIYFTAAIHTDAAGECRVYSLAKAGGTPSELGPGEWCGELVVDGNDVFYRSNTEIRKVAKTGGAPVTLGSSNTPQQLAVDATYVYWIASSTDGVLRVPRAGGSTTPLYAPLSDGQTLVLSGNELIFGEQPANRPIRKMALSGGSATTITTPSEGVTDLAADATHVYWTSKTGKHVMKAVR